MSPSTYHSTHSMPFMERAALPSITPLGAYLLRLMAVKRTNLCLSADVQSTSQLLDLAEECGDSICILKTHADIVSDFGDRTIKGLMEIAARKNFVIFEDRKFGDIGNTVQMQYAAGSQRIARWASIINAHVFPGPAIITSLQSAAHSALAAYNSSRSTEIRGGQDDSYFPSGSHKKFASGSSSDTDTGESEEEVGDDQGTDDDEGEDSDENDNDDDNHYEENGVLEQRPTSSTMPLRDSPDRRTSVVSISTTITSTAEYISPPLPHNSPLSSPPHIPINDIATLGPAPLTRALLLLAQMSSEDNLLTPEYTQKCVEMARQHKDFVIGFIAQQSLNTAPGDNFITMTPGVNLPRPPAREQPRSMVRSSAADNDGQGQQYNEPRHVILEKGVDVIIVGRGILNADDPRVEAERYRKEAWRAYLERVGGRMATAAPLARLGAGAGASGPSVGGKGKR